MGRQIQSRDPNARSSPSQGALHALAMEKEASSSWWEVGISWYEVAEERLGWNWRCEFGRSVRFRRVGRRRLVLHGDLHPHGLPTSNNHAANVLHARDTVVLRNHTTRNFSRFLLAISGSNFVATVFFVTHCWNSSPFPWIGDPQAPGCCGLCP